MLNKTPWTVRWKHLKQWYYGNTTKEEIGQNPEICGLKKEKKVAGIWKVGDFKHKDLKGWKHEFKSGKERQDLANCREQGRQQKRENREVGQKKLFTGLENRVENQKVELDYK